MCIIQQRLIKLRAINSIIHVANKNARLAELADAQRSGRCLGWWMSRLEEQYK